MPTATYQCLVDWTGSGLFDGPYDDITADVKEAAWSIGRDYASQLTGRSMAGSAWLLVKNYEGRYSSFKTASPIYGLVLPARLMKIRMTVAGVTVTEWQGFLDTVEPQPRLGGSNQAVVRGIGPLGLMERADISVAVQTGILTGAAVGAILDGAGWPAADRVIDVGQTTMTRWWTSGDVSALYALREVEATESGFIRETKDGKIGFEDRHHRLVSPHTSSVATYTDDPAGTLRYQPPRQMDPLKEIFNVVQASVQTYSTGVLAVLWSLAAVPAIGASDTLTLWPTYPNSSSVNASSLDGVGSWETPVATTDYTANSAADGSGTDLTGSLSVAVTKFATAMKVVITNNAATAAYLTKFQARGTPIVANAPIPVSDDDAASQAKYKLRTYPSPGRFIPTIEEANDHVRYHLSIRKSPQPVLTIPCSANRSAAQLSDAQNRDVSDRVTVVATGQTDLGINGDFFIEGIRHRVSKGGHVHTYEMDLSPTEGYGGFWVWGVSTMGETTRFGY